MKNLIYSILGLTLGTLLSLQSFAATTTKATEPATPESTRDQAEGYLQEGANAPSEKSNSGQPQNKKTARNVKGRDGKVPTESSKNAQPSQQKTQERTETVE